MWMWVIIGLLSIAYAILVLWYRWAWLQLRLYKVPEGFTPVTSITVIIPARNEEDNIEACLSGIVSQHYPAHLLQVLVVDDASEDNTVSKVQKFSRQFPFMHCLSLDQSEVVQSHKKRAIESGIDSATGSLIVCTDADCQHHPLWLSTLAHRFEQGDVAFIAAPVFYNTQPTILSVFQSLDFMTLQGIAGASVSKRFHTMCNGANIAYSKKAFDEVQGFAGIDSLPTGDDMLLMHKIFKRYPDGVVWLKSREAIVTTKACPTWHAFLQQRIRWASKAAYYDDKRMLWVLLLVYLLNAAFLVAALATIFLNLALWPLLFWLMVKTIVELVFLLPVAHFFGSIKWLLVFPLLQPVHIMYTVVAGWLGRFGSYQWKGRVVKKPSVLVK